MTSRVVAVLSLVVVVVVGLTFLARSAEQRSDFVADYSTYSAAPKGSRALFLTCQHLGLSPDRMVHDLEGMAETGVVLSVAPRYGASSFLLALFNPGAYSGEEMDSIVRWVGSGNTFVLISGDETRLPAKFGMIQAPDEDTDDPDAVELDEGSEQSEAPPVPRRRRRGGLIEAKTWPPETLEAGRALVGLAALTEVAELEVEADAPGIELDADVLDEAGERVTGWSPLLRTVDGRIVGAEARSGRGRFVWLTSPYMASNTGLIEGDNALALLRLVGSAPGDVHFDEFHHGMAHSRSLAGYLRDSTLWIAVCQLALLLIFLGWRAQQRFGAALPTFEEEARGSADHVRAMSSIYRRGGHQQHALSVVIDDVERTLVARYRLPAGVAGAEVEAALVAAGVGGVAERLATLRRQADTAVAAGRGVVAAAQQLATFRDNHSRKI